MTQTANQQSRPVTVTTQQQSGFDGESWLGEALERATEQLERTAEQYSTEIEKTKSRIRKTIVTAVAIEDFRKLLTGDVMRAIMSVQNSKMGFATDQRNGYPEAVVRECVIEGLLKGVYPFNNEFNIIGGNMMVVQNGWRRKLHELPGLEEYPSIQPGDMEQTDRYYKIPCTATWVYEGVTNTLTRNIFVHRDTKQRNNSHGTYTKDDFTTIDNIMGKVERKMLEAVFKKIKGEVFSGLDDGEDEITPRAETLQTKAAELPSQPPATKPQLTDMEKADLRVTDAYKRAKDAGKIDAESYRTLLKDEFNVDARAKLNAAQLHQLATKLELLLTPPIPTESSGGDGMFPVGDTPDAFDNRF